ncbi:MAG TPA: NfeD family protein [Phycisphaerales bacterium]|nr:NfeD family protein [Phycisphaerales bacterium]
MDPLLAWGIGLLVVSCILLIAEAFLPSAGVLGVSAGVAAVAGVICLFRYDAAWGLAGLGSVVVLGPTAIAFLVKVWPHTPIGRRIIGAPTEEEVERQRAEELAARGARAALVGKTGKAVTDLRPVGVAVIDGARHEVLSETTFVPEGASVRVTYADLAQIKVRPVT